MTASLRFSPSASADEACILATIAELRTARRYRRMFRALYLRLAEFPNSGAPRPVIGLGIRIGVVAPFIVIYRYAPADAAPPAA